MVSNTTLFYAQSFIAIKELIMNFHTQNNLALGKCQKVSERKSIDFQINFY